MKIHDLTFRGIGPFEGEQHVDFDALGQAGMFLLEGPTGVGKSTIIDAIVFALYGGVAAQDSDDARLVSHFRSRQDDPYVEMVFSCANGVFRVRRSPGHWRPKARAKNADDLTFDKPSALLMKLENPDEADGTPIGSRPAEVGVAIREAVGLDKEQFVSTIVLPQGQFATFLRAGSKDRQPILQKIFRTHYYEKFQQRLRESGRAAAEQRQAAEEVLSAVLDKFRGAVSALEEAALAGVTADSDGDSIRASLQAGVGALTARHTSAETARQTASSAREAAAAELASVDARLALRDELASAVQRRAVLDSQEDAIRRHREAIRQDDCAARVADAIAHGSKTAAELAAAEAALDSAAAAAPAHLAALPLGPLEDCTKASRGAIGSLTTVLQEERALADKEQRTGQLDARATEVQKKVDELEARRAALPAETAAARSLRSQQQSLAESAARLEVERGLLTSRTRAAEQLAAEEAQALALDAEIATALAALDRAEAEAARVSAAYRAGIAATIGAALEDGRPCPACGSPEHPQPAVPGLDHASVDDVETAAQRATAARNLVEDARSSRKANEVLIESLAAAADGLTVEAASQQLAELESALAAAQRAVGDAALTAGRIADLESEASRLEHEVGRLRQDRAHATAAAAALRADIGEARARIEAELRGFDSIAARVADLDSTIVVCDILLDRRREVDAASRAAAAAAASLAEALHREGFGDAEQARTARLRPEQRQKSATAVKEHESEAIRVDAVLRRPDLAGVDPAEEIDRAPSLAAFQRAQEVLAARQREATETAQVLRQATLLADRIGEAVEARDVCFAETETALTLARLAEGKNVMGMDLATFVLVHRFRSVIEAANLHLSQMSNGRLLLESFEEAEDKRSRAGLGIRVLDLHTETARTPKTLSGGETFYASLSLALGLAEIVTAESGGVELDTLFVDEGFGSLDPETLDKVLAVLDGLRRNGRVLGLVSHVTEMKERIAERVEVRRVSESGPSTLRVVA